MKFLIVGAGALGTIYAAHLARAGHDVTLMARGERAAHLAANGMRVSGEASFTARCRVLIQPDTITDTDVVVIAVKTYDTAAALQPLINLGTGSAFSVQNGVLKNGQLAGVVGEHATLGAVGMLGGEVMPLRAGQPCEVRYLMPGATIIGERDGSDSDRVSRLVGAMTDAGLNARASREITTVEWAKFVSWSGVSAVAVLTRLPTSRFLTDADTALIAARVMRETAAVAEKSGITLPDSGMSGRIVTTGTEAQAVEALMANGSRMSPDFRQSILQDADRGKPLEVNETLGYTVALGAQLGVPTPTLDFCCQVLRVISRASGR
jgi:2-dehydropantoate 2-reductase